MADIDVSPGILENMHKATDANNANKRARNRLIVKAEKGQAGYKDAYEYAGLRGRAAADAIREIEETDLPNGRMYFNIADKTIRPVLEETSDEIFSYASQLLENVNEKAGIHLKPVLPDPEETNEKIKGILDLASSNEHWNEVREETAQTVENFSRKCVDDHIRANAEGQYEAGLTGKVVRTASRGACEWCEDVAGSYEYAAVKGKGEDVWRRHANCDCVIEYEPVKGKRQTVSSGTYRNNKDSLSPEERERQTKEKNKGSNTTERPMARGPRRGSFTIITQEEEKYLRTVANEIGIPQDVLSFNTGYQTSFDERTKLINVRGDVFPSEFAANPESILSEKCALAHEYYGHYSMYPSPFAPNDWRDEFAASYRAAINTPNLSEEDRRLLMIDAFDRARDAGVKAEYNTIARRMIYGYE